MRMSHGIQRSNETKRFICYSLYAWGFPFLLTVITFVTDLSNLLPDEYKPNLGVSSCWFSTMIFLSQSFTDFIYSRSSTEEKSWGLWIFFLNPIAIQISINIALFIMTAIHCYRVKTEIHRMQTNDSREQKKKSFAADKAM